MAATRRGAFADRNADRAKRRYRLEQNRGGSWRVLDERGHVYGMYADKREAQEHLGLLKKQQSR